MSRNNPENVRKKTWKVQGNVQKQNGKYLENFQDMSVKFPEQIQEMSKKFRGNPEDISRKKKMENSGRKSGKFRGNVHKNLVHPSNEIESDTIPLLGCTYDISSRFWGGNCS